MKSNDTHRQTATASTPRRRARLASTAMKRWQSLREDNTLYRHNERDAILDWLHDNMPHWAATERNVVKDNRRDSSWNSAPVDVPRSHLPGWEVTQRDEEILRAAATAVSVSQFPMETDPHILLATRLANPGGAGGVTRAESLTLDEAAQLAHTILAAIDLARGSEGE